MKDGIYAAYNAHPTDAASLGNQLSAYPTRAAAVDACNKASSCIGSKYVAGAAAAPWRTFGGTLWEDVTGRAKGSGQNLNPWVPQPSVSG